MMQKQELSNHGRSVGQSVVSDIKFTSMEGQSSLVNPYIHEDDAEEDDSQGSTLVGGQDSFAKSRNASNNSLRTAATLARATILPPDHNISSRQMQTDPNSGLSAQPGLTLHTNLAPIDSAGEFAQSYFSPLADSPGSTRSSTQAYGYAFPQQPTPNNGWRYDENKHKTAPAMGRAPSREMVGPPGSSFSINGRAMQSPSAAAIQNAQYAAMAQSRSRSASTPDIHNAASSGPRRYANGQIQPSIENMPVPPLPSPHIAQMRIPISRSHTNTPTAGQLPIRSATQSPQMSLGRMPRPLPSQHEYDQQHQARQQPANIEPRSHFQNTPLGISLPVPKPSQLGSQQIQAAHLTRVAQRSLPTQLKVKTWYEPASLYVTIVVPINIKYQSVADRIDSKMSKISKASIASGTAKLRYRDESDLVNIESDEELAMAIDTWAELHEGPLLESKCPDFELFWHETTAR